jgi:hypothetical protein
VDVRDASLEEVPAALTAPALSVTLYVLPAS